MIFVFSLSSCSTTEEKIKQDDPVEIAVLMPLKGPYGEKGKKLAQLIKWGVVDKAGIDVNVSIYDVATIEDTEISAKKLIEKDTKIILGPLFTPSVKELEKYIIDKNIITITLSNNPIAAVENKIFLFGHTPLSQTNFMFNYAFEKGHKDFAILLPLNRHTNNLKKVFAEIIKEREGQIISLQNYESDQKSKDDALDRISRAVDEVNEDVDTDSKPVLFITEKNPRELTKLYNQIRLYRLDSKAVIIGPSDLDIEYSDPINISFSGSKMVPNSILMKKAENDLDILHFNALENLAYDLGTFTASCLDIKFTKENFLKNIYRDTPYNGLSGQIIFDGPIAKRYYRVIKREGNEYSVMK